MIYCLTTKIMLGEGLLYIIILWYTPVKRKNIKTIMEVNPKYKNVDAEPSMSNLVMK